MKYLRLFEGFKQKNITINDIVNCIDNGGVIYATIINNYPKNDPKSSLKPISVDEYGTITVSYEGSNYEVELKNVDKIDFSVNETLLVSDTLDGVFYFLGNTKKNKVAWFLHKISGVENFYETDELLNYLNIDKQSNMVSYLPTNRRQKGWDLNFLSKQRVSIRIGRAVKKIYDTVKSFLNYDTTTDVRITVNKGQKYYLIDVPTTVKLDILAFNENDTEPDSNPLAIPYKEWKTQSNISIKSNDFQIDGKLIDIQDFWGGFKTLILEVDEFVDYSFAAVSSIYDSTLRYKLPFSFNVNIKITSDFVISESDIEKFSNEYISYIKINQSDDNSQLKEVSGEDILFWYDKRNYQSSMGKLGNSCMSNDYCQSYFDIYIDNPNVLSMLILTNIDNKLIGRALVWKLDDGDIFMDRIYTSTDHDDNIFINYAISKGYIYRDISASDFSFFKNSVKFDPGKISVTLNSNADNYDNYPYLDTLSYLDSNNVLSNIKDYKSDNKTLKDTDGKWMEYYE